LQRYQYKEFVFINRDTKGALYQGDHLIFLGNTWSAILQFLHVTNNAEEVRNMFHSQLNTREQVKVTQNKKVI
jgi:hypothetical protein